MGVGAVVLPRDRRGATAASRVRRPTPRWATRPEPKNPCRSSTATGPGRVRAARRHPARPGRHTRRRAREPARRDRVDRRPRGARVAHDQGGRARGARASPRLRAHRDARQGQGHAAAVRADAAARALRQPRDRQALRSQVQVPRQPEPGAVGDVRRRGDAGLVPHPARSDAHDLDGDRRGHARSRPWVDGPVREVHVSRDHSARDRRDRPGAVDRGRPHAGPNGFRYRDGARGFGASGACSTKARKTRERASPSSTRSSRSTCRTRSCSGAPRSGRRRSRASRPTRSSRVGTSGTSRSTRSCSRAPSTTSARPQPARCTRACRRRRARADSPWLPGGGGGGGGGGAGDGFTRPVGIEMGRAQTGADEHDRGACARLPADTNVGLRFEDESWTWAELVEARGQRAAFLPRTSPSTRRSTSACCSTTCPSSGCCSARPRSRARPSSASTRPAGAPSCARCAAHRLRLPDHRVRAPTCSKVPARWSADSPYQRTRPEWDPARPVFGCTAPDVAGSRPPTCSC